MDNKSPQLAPLRAGGKYIIEELLIETDSLPLILVPLPGFHIAQCHTAMMGRLVLSGLIQALLIQLRERFEKLFFAKHDSFDLLRRVFDLYGAQRFLQCLIQRLSGPCDACCQVCNLKPGTRDFPENFFERKLFLPLDSLPVSKHRREWKLKCHVIAHFMATRV